MRFEEEGVFLGLISFPFYIDGGALYREVFEDFLEKRHRENYLKKYAPSGQELDKELYRPKAYRMFGNHGLAIVSLIDDFAFCSRMFNAGHILSDKNYYQDNKFKSIVITGSSEQFLPNKAEIPYLKSRARITFFAQQ